MCQKNDITNQSDFYAIQVFQNFTKFPLMFTNQNMYIMTCNLKCFDWEEP